MFRESYFWLLLIKSQVPYITSRPFPISDDYTVPKGAMVIPAFWRSLHDETVYPEPDSFKPERWLPQEDGNEPIAEQNPQNYLVWGSGPHKVSIHAGGIGSELMLGPQCIGGQYATMHLAAVLGTASVLMDWHHERTDLSDEIRVIAWRVDLGSTSSTC